MIDAVDETCIRILRHKHVGYANVTILTISNHLCDCYARITPTDLEENDKGLKEAYDPDQTIETLIDQVEDAIEWASAGKDPCTPRQLVNIYCALMFDTGVHHDDYNTWKRKPFVDQTWETFKSFFAKAHQDLRVSSQTARSAGFQANNIITG